MKIFTHDLISSQNLSPLQCYQWVVEMLQQKASTILPPKISMKMDNHVFYNVMPCVLPEDHVVGVKVISRLSKE